MVRLSNNPALMLSMKFLSFFLAVAATSSQLNAQTNPFAETKKFSRGGGTEPTYKSFVVPLDGQAGIELDANGDTPSKFSSLPWAHRISESIYKQLTISGNSAAYVSQTNPVVAFGSAVGGSSLYTGRPYRFGTYAGSRSQGAPYNQPVSFVIYAYRKSDFAGAANPVLAVDAQTISPPSELSDAAAWKAFADAGFRFTAPSFRGLSTTIEYVEGAFQQEQWGTSGKSPYIVTHTAGDPNYYFEVRCLGFVPFAGFPGDLAPFSITADGLSYTTTKLYTLDFEQHPNWRADFIDQPHFEGDPIPASYLNKSVEELLAVSTPVTRQFAEAPSGFLTVDQSPELLSHPTLDRLVSDSGGDPFYLINRVINDIELSDFIGYNENGSATEKSVNLSGVRRSAFGTWMEKQGSPTEQCALLVYLLRKANIPAAYCSAAHNEMKLLDLRLSQLFGMQLRGAPDFVGTPTVPHIIPVNYPWVTAYIDGQWRHIFPWLKDYENKEGQNLNEMLPTGYNNGHLLVNKYLTRDSLLMSMSAEADNFASLFEPFLLKSLRDNHPGISLEDVGLRRRLRRHYYSRFDELPQPWSVAETSGPITIRESIGSTQLAFDTISIDIYSNNNPTKRITINDLRVADLHSRPFTLRTVKTGINTHSLVLSLAELRSGAGAFGNFTAALLKSKQTRSLALDSSDDGISVQMTYRAHRTLPVGFQPPAHADAFFGLTESLALVDTRPFRKGDVGVLSLNFGRITSEMIDAGMQAITNEQRRLADTPSAIPDDDIIQGGILHVMGLSYHKEFGDFRNKFDGWSKIRNVSFYSQGVMRLGARRDANGSLPNDGDIDPISPIIDVPIYRGVWCGNGTARPDLQMPEPMARWEPLIVTALEGSSQEHATADRYWKGTGAASTVSLLHNAQISGAGIVQLNADNYVAKGAEIYQGQTLSSWLGSSTWAEITSTMTDAATGKFHYAYVTPGPVTAADGTYRGVGAFIFERKGFAAYITGNLNGGFGKPNPTGTMQPLNYQTINVAKDSKGKPVVTLKVSTAPASVATPTSVTNKDKGAVQQGLQNGTNVSSASLNSFFNQQAGTLKTANSTPATVYKAVENSGSASSTTWWQSTKNLVADPVDNITGAFYHDDVDITLPGPIPLPIRRNYSSLSLGDSEFGWGWKWAFQPYLVVNSDSSVIYASELDGATIAFERNGVNPNEWLVTTSKNPRLANISGNAAGSIFNPFAAKITKTTEASLEVFTLTAADGSVRRYEVRSYPNTSLNITRSRPYLSKWTDSSGNFLSFTFGEDSYAPDYGKVRRVDSSCGQFVVIGYDFYSRIHEIVTKDNRKILYDYDAQGDLRTVTRPDNSLCGYDYKKEAITISGATQFVSTHLIERVREPDGRILENDYNANREVVQQRATVGLDLVPVRNATFDRHVTVDSISGYSNGYVIVSDAYNRATRYDITNSQTTKITHPNTDTNAVADTEEFDFYTDNDPRPGAYQRSLASQKDRRGLVTSHKYSAAGNLSETKVVGDLTGDGVPDEAITSTTYTALRLPDEISYPNSHKHKFLYEDAANPLFWTRKQHFVGITFIDEEKRVFGQRSNGTSFAKGLLLNRYRAFGSPDEARESMDYNATGFRITTTRYTGTTDPNVIVNHVPNLRGEEVQRTDSLGRKWIFFHDDLGRLTGEERFDETGKLVWWNFGYFNENGELEWEDGPRYDPEDYVWHQYDGHGRPKTSIRWRSDPKFDGTGLEAPSGDRLYSTTFFQHDLFNNLVKITDPRQNVFRQDFSNVGWMLARRFYSGDDATGTLVAQESWSYLSGGDIATHTDVLGGVTTNAVTTDGKPKLITRPDGSAEGFRYLIDGRSERQILRDGSYWQTTYDDIARNETRTLRRSNGTAIKSETISRDRRGNTIQSTDPGNFTTTQTFDDLDRIKTRTGPPATATSAQQSTTSTYDTTGKVTVATNAKAESTETEQDVVGRTLRTTRRASDGTVVSESKHQFTPNHAGDTMTAGTGSTLHRHTIWKDHFGQTAIAKRGSVAASVTYTDENGNAYVTADENSKLTVRSFDVFNRASAELQPENTLQQFQRNGIGHITKRLLPGGIEAVSQMNAAGQETVRELRLTSTPSNFINRLTFDYYPAGHAWAGLVKTITDLRPVVQTFTYDEQLRLYQIITTGPEAQQNQTLTYGYDSRNHVTTVDLAFANPATGPPTSVQRQFDGYDHIVDEKVYVGAALVSQVSCTFDNAGRRTQLSGGSGHGATSTFAYRADDLMSGVVNDGRSYTFGYGTDGLLYSRNNPFFNESIVSRNDRGLIEERNVSVGATLVLHEDTSWDAHGIISNYTFQRNGEPQRFFNYSYSDRYKLTLEPFVKPDGNIGALQSQFDSGNQGGLGARTKHYVSGGSSVEATLQSVFGRTITETTNDAPRSITSTGTALGAMRVTVQLDNVVQGQATLNETTGAWSFPLSLQPGQHSLLAQALHPSGTYVPVAASNFNVVGTSDTLGMGYDWLGNVTFIQRSSGYNTTLTWDGFGHPVIVRSQDAAGRGTFTQSVHDGLGRRIQFVTRPITGGVPDPIIATVEISTFDPLVEFLEIGVSIDGQKTWKVYGPDLTGTYGTAQGIGGLLATVLDSSGHATGLITDLYGNTPAWSNGTSVTWNPCRVGAYGPLPGSYAKSFSAGTPLHEAIVWRGRRQDITGFVNMGARLLDPNSGRFLSPDPAGHDGSLSLYCYANGDALNLYDPDGRFGKNVWDGAIKGDLAGRDTGWGGMIGQTAIGFVPIAGQIADIRDIGAAVNVLRVNGVNYSTVKSGAINVVAAVPGLDFLKGAKKGVNNLVEETAQKELASGAAKRGPKTDPTAPHNAKIKSEGDRLADEGNEILAGGGRAPEKAIPTPDGNKGSRRPDVLYKTPDGTIKGLNVGRTKADGSPVTREQKAKDDLNGAGVETDFIPYDR
jgi:RHS repeat-associated protein